MIARRPAPRRAGWLALGLLAAAVACEPTERFRDRFRRATPWEAYGAGLHAAGLGDTALGRAWAAAGQRAIDSAASVSPPFVESGFIVADSPGATGYRVDLPRGRKLVVDVEVDAEARVFVDLFRMPDNPDDRPRPVFWSDSAQLTFVYEPWRSGTYLLRVQPELLRGGAYRVSIKQAAQLAFPVEGRDMRAIRSSFGAPRDGGRRRHQGVDVFAARGTPVLSATAGRVVDVDSTDLGGKVVWVRDAVHRANVRYNAGMIAWTLAPPVEGGDVRRVYYAHLDSQYVQGGEDVQPGDTLGFVGNTGNARTTPPHLHFGLYRRGEGAVDPAPFLRPPAQGPPSGPPADLALLGLRAQVAGGVALRASPASGSGKLREFAGGEAVRVLGVAGAWYRVLLPDGGAGYVVSGAVGRAPVAESAGQG